MNERGREFLLGFEKRKFVMMKFVKISSFSELIFLVVIKTCMDVSMASPCATSFTVIGLKKLKRRTITTDSADVMRERFLVFQKWFKTSVWMKKDIVN